MSEIRGNTVEIEVRWPPFDSDSVIASELPIARESFLLQENADPPCESSIGDKNGFHISRRITQSNSKADDLRDWMTLDSRIPNRILRSRTGWFITPSALHRFARKLIPYAVVGIIASLAIHAFEPALVESGIVDGSFAGSVRLGLLDYPVLLIIFLPIFFVPIMLRFCASIWDYRRTRKFRLDQPMSPDISLEKQPTTSSSLKMNVNFPEVRPNWISANARLQVGLLNPRRPMLLHALGRKEGLQNPPGISTPLAVRQYTESELGTGFGESTPLQGPDSERLFLTPLRVLSRGEKIDISFEGGAVTLDLPEGDWPGSEYHPLFGSHWEILIHIERDGDGPLLFVEPIIMNHDGSPCEISEMPVLSGRSEYDES
ncbi:MAG: hypothetical protein VX627_05065 [Candidatus Thermoplasmatota archaeon]|nr:hypothetical protein [Candidatus Thermoplasmatota archaeon]